MLVSPSRNSVRDQLYEAQIAYHNIDGKPRQLKTRLKQETKGGQRYKQAYVRKEIKPINKRKRTKYGGQHKDKSIMDFWQYVFFTDEAHIDPSSSGQGSILREQGHRLDPENIQERPEKIEVKLHIAAWCTWLAKAEKLEFYNDEHDSIIKPKRPPKPRKSKYESEEYQGRELTAATERPEAVIVPMKNGLRKYPFGRSALSISNVTTSLTGLTTGFKDGFSVAGVELTASPSSI